MFFVVGYFITFAADPEDGDAAVMNIVSLHPMAAFSYGIQTVAKWEDTNFGMSASEGESVRGAKRRAKKACVQDIDVHARYFHMSRCCCKIRECEERGLGTH